MGARDLDFRIFDCDNHYYEATDAFTRHLDPAFRKRGMQWAEIDGRQRLLVGGQDQPVHPESDVGSDLEAGGARRVLPGSQPRRGRTRRSCSATSTGWPIIPNTRIVTPAWPSWTRQGIEGAIFPAHARRRHGAGPAGTTCRPWWPPSGPSIDGWRRTGASPTRSASSPPRTSRSSTPTTRRRSCSGPSTTTPALSSWWAARWWSTGWGARRPTPSTTASGRSPTSRG